MNSKIVMVNGKMGEIRKANVKDVKKIHSLVNHFASKDLMLPRSLNDIFETIRDFFVFEENKKAIGCAALHVSWHELAEIKSVAVSERFQKKGIARQLIEACFNEAKELKIKKIFVLTYKPEYFKKFGFKLADKNKFPHKIWTECINCPKFPKCKEVLLTKKLQ